MTIQDLLSQKDKINQLSKEAIKDIYSRYHLLKKIKARRRKRNLQPIQEKEDTFKQLSLEHSNQIFYKALRENLDVREYTKLEKKDGSLEDAYFKRVTNDKFNEDEKIEIARKKLIETSKCSGVPASKLVHTNVNEWGELEDI